MPATEKPHPDLRSGPSDEGVARTGVGPGPLLPGRWIEGIERHPVRFALVFFVLQILARMPGLGAESLWLDEAFFLHWSRLPVETIVEIAWTDPNPPLYTLVLSAWSTLFGATEAAARSLSVVCMAAAGALLVHAAQRFFSVETALVTAGLFLTSPLAFHYAREARVYAPVVLIAVASFSLFWGMMRAPSRRGALALGLVEAVGAYAHFTLLFVFFTQGIAALLWLRIRPRAVATWLGAQVVAFLLFLPWSLRVPGNAPRPDDWWLGRPGWREFEAAWEALAGGWFPMRIAGALIALALAWFFFRRPDACAGRRVATLVLWGVLTPLLSFVAAQIVPVFLARYVIFAVPGLSLLGGWAITSLPGAVWVRGSLAIAMIAICAFSIPRVGVIPRSDWRSAAAQAQERRAAGDIVVVQGRRHCTPFAYYFAPDLFDRRADLPTALGERGVECLDESGLEALRPDPADSRRLLLIRAVGRGTPPPEIAAHRPVARRNLPGIDVIRYVADGLSEQRRGPASGVLE